MTTQKANSNADVWFSTEARRGQHARLMEEAPFVNFSISPRPAYSRSGNAGADIPAIVLEQLPKMLVLGRDEKASLGIVP